MASSGVRGHYSAAERSGYARTHDVYSQRSRLPSPEYSTKGHDAFKPSDADPSYRYDMDQREDYRQMLRRRDSHHTALPISPPYDSSDTQRPQLPPLKTVLLNANLSPPHTPRIKNTSAQPLPCEPSLTTSTYKPPSLYPNKKLRTDFVFEPVAPITNPYTFSMHGPPSASWEQSPVDGYGNHFYRDGREGRRRSSHQITRIGPSQHSTSSSTRPSPHPDRMPTGMPSSVPFSPRAPHAGSYSRPYHGEERHERRRSFRMDPEAGQMSLPSAPKRYERASVPRGDREDIYGWSEMPDMHPDPHSGYFVPNHYDFKQGKTRKRSNLPKQSTEVMKNWFDKREEVTGISMTQVSNWFINHRRRCPELRDKREKSRGRDYDM
ncbi:homeodomain superfamily [Saxophila tyrrhenica]|uniref:Homeodomain superfamily n=1 Tax=Saxophila tyrrhenica TaxID=1690608 RepID=A0AAV9PB11_9PEZI|nr:homeodomain superfamily [Saxophila tyrrhenica]